MIAVIDYDVGNIRSVINILNRLNEKFILTNSINEIDSCDKIILPGVSNFKHCMKNIRQLKLDHILKDQIIKKKKSILGICSGMQILSSFSEEGNVEGLNMIKGNIKKIPNIKKLKVPHMGWNKINVTQNKLLIGIKSQTRFYFCHSYYFCPTNLKDSIAETTYGIKFCTAFNSGNIYGVQFHPEKSLDHGMKIIKNFQQQC